MEAPGFPAYTDAERTADRLVHLFGMVLGPAAALWLMSRAVAGADIGTIIIGAVYSAGLLAMLASSAAYNLARPGRLKGRLRRLDHAMIFAMIAGSYTPFALFALAPSIGVPLCAIVWVLALAGMMLTLSAPRRLERLSLLLYLATGWLVLLVIRPLMAALPGDALALLIAGGVVYSLGAMVHTRNWPFQNALWHAMVLVAAALHFVAIIRTFRFV